MQVTVCGKIKDTSLYPVLDATSHLMDKVERLYFKERYIKHADRNGLKRYYLPFLKKGTASIHGNVRYLGSLKSANPITIASCPCEG